MATITIPNPATAYEVRAAKIVLGNNLDVHLSNPPTQDELIAKYSDNYIDRVIEPIDADGKPCGKRQYVESLRVGYADIAERIYTRPDGTTFTGAQFAWDAQIMADAHKATGLQAAAATQAKPQE